MKKATPPLLPAGSRTRARRTRLLALEPRVLFDGVALHDTSGLDSHTDSQANAAPQPVDKSIDVSAVTTSKPAPTPVDTSVVAVPAAPSASAQHELLFIDGSVPDADQLIAGTRSDVTVVKLEAGQDPFEQIGKALAEHPDTTAVHIVSHGGSGFLELGGQTITEADLLAHADQIAQWRSDLAPGADVLIYGCDVGAGDTGASFVNRLAELTGADVAASTNDTGAASAGGDWTLETSTGSIEARNFLTADGIAAYQDRLSTISLSGSSGWVPIMVGTSFDPQGDSQAGAADTDIVGDATHAAVYAAYDDGGTPNDTSDDMMAYRMRIDNPTSSTYFGGVAIIGMDANLDGKIDLFFSVDGRNNGQAVKLLDPGTDANISPSTTSTAPLPSGWIASNGIYSFNSSNYSVVAVSAATDPNWDGNADLGGDGKTDAFISFKIPFKDVQTVLAKPSPTSRSGNVGPRGATGITDFTKDSVVQYVAMTQTQLGPINGDIGGVGDHYDKNASFSSLGTFSAQMSASNPVAAATTITIDKPVDSDGTLNASEDAATTIFVNSNLSDHSKTIDVTVTDSGNHSVNGTATYDSVSGKWKVTEDLSSLNDGTLTVSAKYDPDGNASTLNSVSDSTTVLHDRSAPGVTINQLTNAPSGTPTLSGTTDLAAGSVVKVTVDVDNDSGTADVIYQALVIAGVGGGANTWSVDTASVTPSSGSLPSSGLTNYTKITASATDSAGNIATATALNHPTVTTLSTNSSAPTISGTWTNLPGDTLTVTVSGATYTLTPSGNNWTLNLATATPSSGTLTALTTGNTYEVVATVTRSGNAVSDTTTSELTITNTPVVSIGINGGGSASGSDTTPMITGTSANAGGYVIVRLDPNNDGNLSDAVTYSVTPDGSGNWSLDTGSATPISGTAPAGGFVGATGVHATDSSGAVAADQALTISSPTIAIGSIGTGLTTDTASAVISNSGSGANWLNTSERTNVTVSGTANGGSMVDLTIIDVNGNTVIVSNVAVSGGSWSATGINLSSLNDGALTVKASLDGTTVSATNTGVALDSVAPQIFNTTADQVKKSSPVITGGSQLTNTELIVTLTYSGSTQTVDVITDASGRWSTATPAPGTTGLSGVSGSGGAATITVAPKNTTTDAAGNIVQAANWTQTLTANASTNTISIGTISGDGVITYDATHDEISSGVTLSGTTTLTGTPTITLQVTDSNNTSVTLTATASGGSWSATLTDAQIKTLANGPLTVLATAPDGSLTIRDVSSPTLSLLSPTLTITDDTSGTATGPVLFTFTFTEAATGFDASDITVTGGTAGTFTAVDSKTYTLSVTPAASSTGNISVSVANGAATGATTGRSNIGASDVQAYVTTGAASAPTVTVNADALATSSTPTITGTSSLSAGAPVVITIDPDNDTSTSNNLTYSATVQSDGSWSLDLAAATPTSGSLPSAGLQTYAKISATATNAYGNSTTAIALDKPAVTREVVNSSTPAVSGTWTNIAGDTLTVDVNGTTYSQTNGNLTISNNTWSLTTGTLVDGAYDVTAKVTRSATSKTDVTSSELTIDTTAPTVAITSASGTNDRTPVISGTTDLPAGSVITITVDPDNNASTSNSITYTAVVAAGSGSNTWSIDTGSLAPTSGTFPVGGLYGLIGVKASGTDSAGNNTQASQTLNVDITPPVVSITSNSKTPDTTPLITGTSDIGAGGTITLVVDPDNIDGGTTYTYTATVQNDGTWSVDTTSAIPSGSGSAIIYTNGNTIGLSATATDSVGNTGTATKAVQITTAPTVSVTTPIDSGGDGTLNATEDDSVTIKGNTTDVGSGSALTVLITDGTTTISDTATVDASGNWQLAPLNLSGMVNGTISVSASYVDGSGDTYSGNGSVLHDKISGGGVSIDSISNDTGVIADFITSDNTLVFKGSATANASVTVTLSGSGGQVFSTGVTADSGGNWSYDYTGNTLADGDYTLTATTGGTPATQAITIDTAAPAGPVTVTGQTTADTTPTLTGTAAVASGESLTVAVNGKTYAAGDGQLSLSGSNWSLTLPAGDALTTGTYEVTAKVIDTAGNSITDGTSNELVIDTSDTTAPAAPGLSLLASSDSGSSNSDAKTSDDTPAVRVSLNGTGATAPVAGDVVKLYSGVSQVGTTTLTSTDIANGYVDITTSTLGADGAKSLTATVTDTTGNASSASSALAITLDKTAPALSSATVNGTALTLTYSESGSGFDSTTPATSDFVVTKNGGTTITVNSVSIDTAAKTVTLTLASAVTNADAVTLAYTPGANKTQDIAGNTAVSLTNQAVTNNSADTTAPAAPTVSLLASSDSGSSNSDAKTSDDTPTIRVQLNGSGATAPIAGDVVKLYSGATQVGTATLTSTDITAGYVDVTTSTLGADGTKSLTATVTDAAANTSGASSALDITLDAAAPVLSTAAVNGTTLTLTYTETGSGFASTVPAASDFAVTKNGDTTITVNSVSVDTAAKTITLTLASAVTNADTVALSYTPGTSKTQDIAGNTAASLTNRAVTNSSADTTATAAPSLSLLASSDSGSSNSDAKTNDDTPAVRVQLNGSGAAAPVAGDIIKVYSGATQVGTATLTSTDITNHYVDVTTSTLGADGAKTLSATVTDAASNVSSASSALDITLDTAAPALSTAAVNGNTLTLTYTESGSGFASTTPAASDFAVTKNGGTIVAVNSVSVDTTAKTLTLTLASAITNADTVTLSYTPGTNKTQDIAGNTAVSLAGQTVTNSSADTTAPAAPSLSLLASSDSGSSNSDAKTSDDTPAVRVSLNGTGVTAPIAGDVAKLYSGVSQVGTATLTSTDIANGYVDITTSALGTDGVKSLTATITDTAANTSSASSALGITLDTTAPVLSAATVNGTTLTLTYTETGSGFASSAPAASDFAVTRNGDTTITVNSVSVDATAKTVTLTLASAVTNADTVTLDYTPGTNKTQDIAGNTAASLASRAVANNSSDTTAAAAPGLSLLASSDSGSSNSDAKTSDDTPAVRVSLNGTGATAPVAGDVVKLYSGVSQVGTTTLTSTDIANGYVDITTSTLGADGAKSLTATVTDTTGNVSSASSALAITLDKTAPVLSSATVNGTALTLTYSESGSGFGSTTPATSDFVVTKNGGTTITVNSVSVDTAAKTVTLTLASAVTNADAVTLAYTPGANKTQDIAGNTAVSLTNQAVTNNSADTTAPAAPTVSLLASSDSGSSNSDRITNDTTPTIRIQLNGSGATAPIAGDVVKLYSGATQVGTATLTSTDITAGYVDVTTSALGADGAKNLTATEADSAGNTSSASPALDLTLDTTVTAPTVALAHDTGSSASDGVSSDGTLDIGGLESGATVQYSTDGTTWSNSFTASEGSNTVQVRQIDRAGNVSASTGLSFTVDTSAPLSPGVALNADTGGSDSDAITRDGTLHLTGVEPDATVEYSTDGVHWSTSFTPSEGSNTVHVRQTDAAGNVGSAATLNFTLDTTAATPGLSLQSDTGVSAGDRITSNGTLQLADVETGALIEYSTDGITWTTGFSPVEGDNTVYVRQTDTAGNVSGTNSLSFRLDRSAAAPGIALATDTGSSASDRLTRDGTLSLSSIEPGATVEYSIDGIHWSASFTPSEGANTVYVRQTDTAGNVSAASSLSFTLDTVAAAPSISLLHDTGASGSDRITNDGRLAVGGIEPGAHVEYSLDGLHWSDSFTAIAGDNTAYVRQTDTAGNISPSASLRFTLETLQPLPDTDSAAPSLPVPDNAPAPAAPAPIGPVEPILLQDAPAVPRAGRGSAAGPVSGSSSTASAIDARFSGNDQTSTQPNGRINLLAGIDLSSNVSSSAVSGPDNSALASTDRGFPVSRLDAASSTNRGSTNASLEQAQQKGVDRLFVYQGVHDTGISGGTSVDYFVPRDAFGHTNVNAIVQLDASLRDGSPLPEWLDFDPISGRFSGRPPADAHIDLTIKVTARDNDGREASTTFHIKVEPAAAKNAAASAGRDAGDRAPVPPQALARDAAHRHAIPFKEQLRTARPARDPLLARIAAAPQPARAPQAAQPITPQTNS